MNYRHRLRQIDETRDLVGKAFARLSEKDYVPSYVSELVRELLDREANWAKQAAKPGCTIGEGGVYSLPLRYIGGANNLRFELPDGVELLVAVGAQKFLREITPPAQVEKQQEMAL